MISAEISHQTLIDSLLAFASSICAYHSCISVLLSLFSHFSLHCFVSVLCEFSPSVLFMEKWIFFLRKREIFVHDTHQNNIQLNNGLVLNSNTLCLALKRSNARQKILNWNSSSAKRIELAQYEASVECWWRVKLIIYWCLSKWPLTCASLFPFFAWEVDIRMIFDYECECARIARAINTRRRGRALRYMMPLIAATFYYYCTDIYLLWSLLILPSLYFTSLHPWWRAFYALKSLFYVRKYCTIFLNEPFS